MTDDQPNRQRTLWTNEEWLRAVARAPAIEPANVSDEEQAQRRVGGVLQSRYILNRLLGMGGMAAVYAATHRNGHEVAIKILHPSLSIYEDIRARFLREGYLANKVGHQGALLVLDDDVAADGCAFLVMELLKGESLQTRLQRLRRIDAAEVLTTAEQLLDVLVAAHAQRIVHRDLKPDNLFLTLEGRLKVLDFGVARAVFCQSALTTDEGRIVGTPAFMSPEQARGLTSEIDAQTDIWAVGATMFTLLTGKFVHHAATVEQITRLAATVAAPPMGSVAPDIPLSVAALVDRALKFAKHDRWENAAAMAAAVSEARGSLPKQNDAPRLPETMALAPTVLAEDPPAIRAVESSVKLAVESSHPVSIDHKKLPLLPPARRSGAGRWWRFSAVMVLVGGALALAVVRNSSLLLHLAAKWIPARSLPEMTMVHLTGGLARVGRSEADRAEECRSFGDFCRPDVIEREQPEHIVTLSPFLIDVREVTNDEFARWLRMIPTEENYLVIRSTSTHKLVIDLSSASSHIGYQNGSFFVKEGHERQPVIEVSWDGARMYCESKGKRLPTEAEREFAARGDLVANRRFPWGNDPPRCDGIAYGRGKDAEGNPLQCGFGRGPEEVLQSAQDITPDGVHDLGGNVSEWVEDAYAPGYPDCGACINPVARVANGPNGDERVFRGASYSSYAFLPSSSRGHWARDKTTPSIGFRCAADVK
jgi:serine/threonine protein kinase/formylglycine-generating enzyme required for sulfatase activity